MGVLERSWGHLGWNLGRLGRVLEPLGDILGPSWSVLGGSWRVLGGLGGFQKLSGKLFLRIFLFLKQFMEIAKNLGKPMVFH